MKVEDILGHEGLQYILRREQWREVPEQQLGSGPREPPWPGEGRGGEKGKEGRGARLLVI